MIEYLISMIIVFVLPSLYVLYKRKRLIKPMLKIGTIGLFIGFVWDYIAVHRGWWIFPNKQYLLGIYFFGLPIEEFIFFFTCPIGIVCCYEILIREKRKK